jgi:hypothetical protein
MTGHDPIDERRIEAVDPLVARCLRRMTPAQRVAQMFASNRLMRQIIARHLRSRHADWSEQQVQAEVARRMQLGSG